VTQNPGFPDSQARHRADGGDLAVGAVQWLHQGGSTLVVRIAPELPVMKGHRMAQDSHGLHPTLRSAAHSRDRAVIRVRRLTAVIGLTAVLAASGLGVLIASEPVAHSATGEAGSVSTATTRTGSSGTSGTGSSRTSSASSTSSSTSGTSDTGTTGSSGAAVSSPTTTTPTTTVSGQS
jgi:hypothetical protein